MIHYIEYDPATGEGREIDPFKSPDLVAVVRCRDCKHFTPKGTHKFENGKVNADYCDYVRGWMLQITPDGFCAWASRKEVDE